MTFSASLQRTIVAVALAAVLASTASSKSAEEFRKRLSAATSSVKDVQATMVITPVSISDAGEINKGVLQFLDHGFREASIWFQRPDNYKIQGKSKGVDVTYILSGNKKQVLVPALMLKTIDDLSDDIAKKQSTLDVGFASDLLWRDNAVSLISESKGTAKLKLVPRGTENQRHEFVWLDSKSLKMLKRERYGGDGSLKSRYIYTNHRTFGKIPIATLVKAYAPDGGYAGTISYNNLRVNTGISESLFIIK
ncbi:MAG: hypothetical protein HYX78_00275 [Armatimonadetes bacterium]|nr:hypothetical protein [Armatimonadota bacterium]